MIGGMKILHPAHPSQFHNPGLSAWPCHNPRHM
jgi:hypothetical protein